MKDLRIAAVTCPAPLGRKAENVERMRRWTILAVQRGADIICFPEMSLTGYTTRREIQNIAEPIPGHLAGQVAELAATEGIIVLAGMAERDAEGRVHVSHVAAMPDGGMGVYRKLHMAPPEQTTYTAGAAVGLFPMPDITFGIQLCYDAHFPELSTLMALEGADVIFIPHASPRGTPEAKYRSWLRHLPARAYDNGLFIVTCNQCGENGAGGLSFPGVVMVIGPSGKVLGKRIAPDEGMLIVDLNASDLAAVRGHRMRYFLPQRRPELIQRLRRPIFMMRPPEE